MTDYLRYKWSNNVIKSKKGTKPIEHIGQGSVASGNKRLQFKSSHRPFLEHKHDENV